MHFRRSDWLYRAYVAMRICLPLIFRSLYERNAYRAFERRSILRFRFNSAPLLCKEHFLRYKKFHLSKNLRLVTVRRNMFFLSNNDRLSWISSYFLIQIERHRRVYKRFLWLTDNYFKARFLSMAAYWENQQLNIDRSVKCTVYRLTAFKSLKSRFLALLWSLRARKTLTSVCKWILSTIDLAFLRSWRFN